MSTLTSRQQDALIIFAFLLLPWILCYNFFSQYNMIMGDNWRAAFPAYQLTLEKMLAGSSLLWNEFSLAGHPFLAEIVNGVLYPPKLLLYLILPTKLAYNSSVLLHLSFTGWFTYLYLRSISLARTAAFFGGTLLMFSPIYLIQELDSISLLHTITWFPLIMYLMEKRVVSGQKKFLLFAALVFVVQIFAGFTQDAFYTAFAVIIYSAMRYYAKYQHFSASVSALFYDMIFFGLITISFATIQLLPTQELLTYAQHYQQSWNLIEAYSAPPLGLLTFFHPFLWGGFANGHGFQTSYFLASFTSNDYMGIVTITFALYALTFWKQSNIIKTWTVLLILTLLIAAGTHIMPIAKLLYAFPLTHAFRFHTRMYFISSMAVVVLFAYSFDYLLRQDRNGMQREIRKLLKLGGFIGFTMFIFMSGIIVAMHFLQPLADKIGEQILHGQSLHHWFQYYQWHNMALFMPFIALILAGSLLWLLPLVKNRKLLFCGLWLICVFEVWIISNYFLVPQKNTYPNADLMLQVKSLLQTTERISVTEDYFSPIDLYQTPTLEQPVRFADSVGALYKIPTLDGFVSFDERNIASLSNNPISLAQLGQPAFLLNLLEHRNDFLSMLGLKYFVIHKRYATDVAKLSLYKKIFTMNDYIVYENPKAQMRIFSLSDVRGDKNINYSEINLLKTAVINNDVNNFSGLGIATIEQIHYRAGNVKTKVHCQAIKCFVVLAESYFPGWHADVDGKKATLYKVNDLIMGTFVDKGEHRIRFRYLPDSVIIGLSLFFFGLIWVPIWMWRKRGASSRAN